MAQPRRMCGHVASARKSALNVSCHSDDLVLLVFDDQLIVLLVPCLFALREKTVGLSSWYHV